MTRSWHRFRLLPLWAQILVWGFLWPVPLSLWAVTRPKGLRAGPALLAVAGAAVWVAVPLSSSSSPSPGQGEVATQGRSVGLSPEAGLPSTGPAAAPGSDGTVSSILPPVGSSTTGPGNATNPTPAAPTATSVNPLLQTTTSTTGPPAGGDPTAVLAGLRVASEGRGPGTSGNCSCTGSTPTTMPATRGRRC